MRPCAPEYTPLATGCKGCRPASWARDLVAARGITINGLPVIDARYRNLHLSFLDHVIGGPGAFAIPAYGFKDFAAAVLNKLIREIAGTTPASDVAMDRAASRVLGTRRPISSGFANILQHRSRPEGPWPPAD